MSEAQAVPVTNGVDPNASVGSVDKSAPAKPPTMHERMVAAAKATKEAVDAGKVTEEAVREGAEAGAAATEGATDTVEEETAEAKPAKDAKEKTEPAENPIARIQREMRAREKARTIELEAQMRREEVEQERQRFQQERAAFEQEQRQLRQAIETLKSDPLKFIESQGYDGGKLAEHIVKAGTPEAQLQAELAAIKAENRQIVEYLKMSEEQQRTAAQQADIARKQEAQRAAERSFVTNHATPEKAPNLNAVAKLSRQGESYIVARAEEVAAWFKSETGKYPSLETLAEYLEQQATEDLKEIRGGAQTKAPKIAGKSTATTRTLSQDAAGERRSTVKPLETMTKAERLAAMEAAARDARRGAG